MPTQEQINAANMELQIANDNYAALANQYNRYKSTLQAWADADPETREKSKGLADEVVRGLEEIRGQMYAAEDRINVAQNRVNSMNETIAAQQAQQATRRRVVARPASTVAPEVPWDINKYGVVGPQDEELPPTTAPEVVTNNNTTNPYTDLYNSYINAVANGTNAVDFFSGVSLPSVNDAINGLRAAGISDAQLKTFLTDWLTYDKLRLADLNAAQARNNSGEIVTAPETVEVAPEATNVAPTVASETIKVTPVATMLVPGEGIVTIGSDGSRTVSTEGGINTFTELPSDYEEVMNTKLTPVEPYVPQFNKPVLRRVDRLGTWAARNPAYAYSVWSTPGARDRYFNAAFPSGRYYSSASN